MITVMNNKIKIIALFVIMALVIVGYALTQGSAFSKTDEVLQKVEKSFLSNSLSPEKAQELRDTFLIVSGQAQEQAVNKEYGLHDFSALLQAHLTTLDVLDDSQFNDELVLVRDALITRIVEVEALLVGDAGDSMLLENGLRDLIGEIENTLNEFQDIKGTIPSRMFDEIQVSIQQSGVALGEAQAALTENMENEASRSTLRARRFIKEAQFTIDLARLIQKEQK